MDGDRLSGPTAAVQDYVKAIYELETRNDTPVSTNALAERLRLTTGSVSTMLRRMADLELVEHEPYYGVRLTERGQRVALEVLRRHRLLERYLVEELGIPWDRVHDEAEVLEHVISREVEDAIATKLGHPTADPHGDPIPSRDFTIAEPPTRSLDDLAPGSRGRFIRVSDAEPAMLRYLGERGIGPGDDLEVVDRQPFDGPLTVRFGTDEHVIGGQLARAMRVQVTPAADADPGS